MRADRWLVAPSPRSQVLRFLSRAKMSWAPQGRFPLTQNVLVPACGKMCARAMIDVTPQRARRGGQNWRPEWLCAGGVGACRGAALPRAAPESKCRSSYPSSSSLSGQGAVGATFSSSRGKFQLGVLNGPQVSGGLSHNRPAAPFFSMLTKCPRVLGPWEKERPEVS